MIRPPKENSLFPKFFLGGAALGLLISVLIVHSAEAALIGLAVGAACGAGVYALSLFRGK